MNRRREPCRNFQRGSCSYGERCKFLHVPQQQSRPNSSAFNSQNNSQLFNTNQQQKPNPFGFGAENNQAKPFENKWTRPGSTTTTTNSAQQGSKQPQAADHQCTDPETCKRQIEEDYKNESPLWKLTCYGHWKYRPCDVVGDISYEELRAMAYEEGKRGVPMQAIVERERNLCSSKCTEFNNLRKNPYVTPNSNIAGANLFSGANTVPFMGVQNNAPAQNNTPPSFSSFSQPGASSTFGSNAGPQAPPMQPSSIFGQPNLPQFRNQSFGGTNKNGNSGIFGNQVPTQPFGSAASLNATNFQFGVKPTQSNQISSPFAPTTQFPNVNAATVNQQFPSVNAATVNQQSASIGATTINQWPTSLNATIDIPVAVQQASTSENQEEGVDDSIWLKEEWAIGEIPIVAPPPRLCL